MYARIFIWVQVDDGGKLESNYARLYDRTSILQRRIGSVRLPHLWRGVFRVVSVVLPLHDGIHHIFFVGISCHVRSDIETSRDTSTNRITQKSYLILIVLGRGSG